MKIITLFIVFIFGIQHIDNYQEEIIKWQNEHNESFKNPEESPLEKKDFKKFKSLDYFPIDSSFRVIAKFKRTPNEMPFTMPTTTERLPVYIKYGIATFEINGRNFSIPVFQNQSLKLTDEYKDYLFLPFTDLTNGFDSYGGGRYVDLRIPNGDKIVIDFNKAYNPYCAYNGKYSCPIPPRSNDLDIKISAGVKAWEH